MEDLPKVNNVRAIIDLFEENCRNENAQRLNKPMSKSFAGLSYTERKFKSNSANDNDTLYNLDKRLTSLSLKLRDYRAYSKDVHMSLQEELIDIMSILLDVDTKSSNTIMYRKRELAYDIRDRFKELSDRLPSSSDSMRQGFGDFTYKPFIWNKRAEAVENISSSRHTNSQADSLEPFKSKDILLSPGSFKRSADFIIGAGGTRRPVNSIGFDTTLRGTSDDYAPTKTFQRSTSEVSDAREKPTLIGTSEYAKRWTDGYQQRDRRRPVSLGGTVVTLNSPEDIISSVRMRKEQFQDKEEIDSVIPNKNNGILQDYTNLQSVNLLKKFFELKSVEKEIRNQVESLSGQEDQRENFVDSVQVNDESIQVGGERMDASSSNMEDDVLAGAVVNGEERGALSRSTSTQVEEEFNAASLRNEEKADEIVITSSIHNDEEEMDSFCSEQSIYLDPVD
ncbi:uncharacterized protein LOC123316265 [Coccinella septempunctata]|uniref:uncharacterized protein LOC123316265 n=1 Tax=Coccinella septempunctata TaxID=41139 RepID=UPI001D07F4E3|nr:uncharacterized protein LOC123316265 [Coccinella septempunctata]XP_044758175.1 uncharacterized protein LOC123316265 [Coccinella septempunctata]